MRKILGILFITVVCFSGTAQISEMKWELDYQIFLKLANDSNYTYDIREVFHVNNSNDPHTTDFIFYPVNPGAEFADEVPARAISDSVYSTLWNALHSNLGGGWIHFTNCIAYALETGRLSLTAPLMLRPETGWKPKPMTDSYKRTKKWDYYIPYSQKHAQQEYLKRVKSGDIGDLKSLPPFYIELFQNTNQKEYDALLSKNKKATKAKIDLVKIILGANYLGKAQISYLSNSVLEAVLAYSSNMLPSLIIFDEFEAAAAMSLNANGYKIENIVYRSGANITKVEAEKRQSQIQAIIDKINSYNQNSFRKRLDGYYNK